MNLKTAKGAWKDEQSILTMIREANPPLKRSAILRANSGRYSSEMVVHNNLVTADNPTGMIVPLGIPLETTTWSKLKEQNLFNANSGEKGALTVALVLRRGDPNGGMFERTAAVVNMQFLDKNQSSTGNIRMVKVDVGEDSSILHELGIKELPTFLMYGGGKLLYAGPIGGRKVKKALSSARPQVLIVEPDFKQQIAIEKILKKLGCDPLLCMTVSEAVDRLNQINTVVNRGEGAGSSDILVDLVLISSDCEAADYEILSKRLGPAVVSKRTVICGLVNILGDFGRSNLDAAKWSTDFCTKDVQNVLNTRLSQIVHIAMQKPIKQASVIRALALRDMPSSDECFGLTPDSLHMKIINVREKGPSAGGVLMALSSTRNSTIGSGISLPYIGIQLCTEEVTLRGRRLQK